MTDKVLVLKSEDFLREVHSLGAVVDREVFRRLLSVGLELLDCDIRRVSFAVKTAQGTISRWEHGHTAPAPFMRTRILCSIADEVKQRYGLT